MVESLSYHGSLYLYLKGILHLMFLRVNKKRHGNSERLGLSSFLAGVLGGGLIIGIFTVIFSCFVEKWSNGVCVIAHGNVEKLHRIL